MRGNRRARAFLDRAGPGAILGGAVLLAEALHCVWQLGNRAAALFAMLRLKRGVVQTLIAEQMLLRYITLAGL